MNARPIAHLLCGIPGCGKTTFALELERKGRVVRFTHDEWMRRLFGEDPPEGEFPLRAAQISELIWETARRVLATGTDVVLDMGFWTRSSRDEARRLLSSFDVEPRLYAFECSVSEARARVLARTALLPAGALRITERTFEALAARMEPMAPDETFLLVRSGVSFPAAL